jgi:hypothetical protein
MTRDRTGRFLAVTTDELMVAGRRRSDGADRTDAGAHVGARIVDRRSRPRHAWSEGDGER